MLFFWDVYLFRRSTVLFESSRRVNKLAICLYHAREGIGEGFTLDEHQQARGFSSNSTLQQFERRALLVLMFIPP